MRHRFLRTHLWFLKTIEKPGRTITTVQQWYSNITLGRTWWKKFWSICCSGNWGYRFVFMMTEIFFSKFYYHLFYLQILPICITHIYFKELALFWTFLFLKITYLNCNIFNCLIHILHDILDLVGLVAWRVSSHFHTCFSPISSPCWGSNPAGQSFTLT